MPITTILIERIGKLQIVIHAVLRLLELKASKREANLARSRALRQPVKEEAIDAGDLGRRDTRVAIVEGEVVAA